MRWHTDGERRRFCLVGVRPQASDQIDEEAGDIAVAGVVTLGNSLELIVHRFAQGALAE